MGKLNGFLGIIVINPNSEFTVPSVEKSADPMITRFAPASSTCRARSIV